MRAGQRCGCPALLGGGDLLSHFRSTIGAVRFNFSVRNGKRWSPHAITTLVLSSPPVWCVKVRSLIGSASFLSLCRVRAFFAFISAPDSYLSYPPRASPRLTGGASGLLSAWPSGRLWCSRKESYRDISIARLGHRCPCTCNLSTS